MSTSSGASPERASPERASPERASPERGGASWRARWRAHWFAVPPARALGEGLLIQALPALWALWRLAALSTPGAVQLGGAAITIAGPCALLYCAFRLRAPSWRWWLRLPLYGVMGGILAISPTWLTVQLWQRAAVTRPRPISTGSTVWLAVAWLIAYTGAFLTSRGGARLIAWWNRLRRQRLVWSLTHAHLMVVVLVASLLVGFDLISRIAQGSLSISLLPILFFFFLLTCVVLVIVLPPSVLFSYLFARTLTRRLERLTHATSALRAGDYHIRVPVEGADEVAQLQADFNAMADALERAVAELHAQRDAVAELLRARRELVASVSHELRTPVATLRGYLESTNTHWNGAPPPTLRQDLHVMEREAIRLQVLIQDLFTLARAEVGRLDLACAPTDVATLARQAVEAVAALAWQSGRVAVVAEVAPDLPPALADAARLDQVLRNLLHNGVRHTPPGGIVALAARGEGDALTIAVRDTGEGIPAAELPRVWERFYRTVASREQPESGSGLGLALVKELTEAMGGSVSVTSVVGEGSCFAISVPRAWPTAVPSSAR